MILQSMISSPYPECKSECDLGLYSRFIEFVWAVDGHIRSSQQILYGDELCAKTLVLVTVNHLWQ